MKRRVVAGTVFLSVFFTLAVGIHLYLATRLVLAPEWPPPLWSAGLGVLAIGFGLLLAQLLARAGVGPRPRALAFGAYVWMGFAFLLLTATAATDGLAWLMGAATGPATDPVPLERLRALVAVSAGVTLGSVALRRGLAPPAIRRIEIGLRRWPQALDGFRIAQISDVHIGPLLDRRFARVVADKVNALSADLVVVTGDLVDGSVGRIGEEVAPLGEIRAPHGVFFVTGNHDYYSDADSWVEKVRSFGWRPLRNESVRVGEGDASFDLAGVDDHHGSLFDEGEDLERALAGRDPERPVVLLAHDPTTFKRASQREVDLQISGHTHGGQLWPFHWLVRATVPWVAGLYRVGHSALYVSRGTGFWGPPMRLGAPSEVTELVLRSVAS